MSLEEILGKGLRALESCRGRTRPEARQALFLKAIDDACNERCLRTDNRQPDRLGFGEIYESVDVRRCNRHITHAGLDRGTGVTRCDEDFVNFR